MKRTHPPPPTTPPSPGSLPAALTFFLTASQRREVLARLRVINQDRTSALLAALKITAKGDGS